MSAKKPNSKKLSLRMKRLVAAHKVLLLVAVTALVGVIGFVGYSAWQQMSANAGDAESLATLSAEQRQYADKMGTRNGCFLAGRVWGDVNNICRTECRAAGVKYVKANDAAKGHCEGYIAVGMDPAHCIRDLHRYFILEAGCARRAGGDSANDARQCIPGYPNYLNRDGQDRCVVREVERPSPNPTPNPTPTPPPNPTPTPTPQPVAPPKTDTAKDCRLLGRTWNAEEKKCRAVCMEGTGSLLTGAKSGVKYCNKAVSVTKQGNQNGCEDKLHRVWLVEGCARRPDQKDATRSNTELLIQCQPGFNFYNADFNNKAEDTETLRDVCELNKATAMLNEKSGNPGHQTIPRDPEMPGGNQGPKDPPSDPNEPSGEGYKIIVYTERDFKGASLTIKGDSPELKNGWDNNIESYKIISGRWQLCEDAGYQTNCIKPWASDTDMRLARKDDGKKKNAEQQRLLDEDNLRTSLVNRVSSLRPVSLKTFEDTANDVMPSCQTADGTEVLALENGFCPKGTVLTCPDGLVLKNRECKQVVLSPSLIVPVDKSFKKDKNGERDCRLLGREWIGEPEDGEVDNGGNYGCSIVTCRLERDGRPKRVVYNPQDQEQKATDTFCISYKHDAPYAVKLDKDPKESKKKCDERNRVWIQQVRLCAQVPNRKDRNQVVVDAEQCVGSGRIYYIFKETTKMDECFTQTLFERAQSVAKSTGGVLNAALKQGPRAYCNVVQKGNYHWNGEKCVIDRKTCPDGKSVPVTSVCHKVCPNGKRIPVTKQCPAPAPTPDSNADSDTDDKNVQGPTTKHLPCATYRNQYDRYIGCVVPRASGLSFRLVCHLYDGRESGAYYRTSPKHVVGSTTYIADNACGFAN